VHRELHSCINAKEDSERNKLIALEFKKLISCERCGYNNCNKALDFHHQSDKLQEISDAVANRRWKTVQDIEDDIKIELDKCIVLCANCHRTEHSDVEHLLSHIEEIQKKADSLPTGTIRIDRERLFQLHAKGFSQREIARTLKCGFSTVCGIMKEAGIHCYPKNVDTELVIRLRNAGMSQSGICEKIGVHHMTLKRVMKELDTAL
jgi:hypothetical protein